MSFTNEHLTHPVPILSSIESQNLSGKEPKAVAGSEDEKFAEQPLEIPVSMETAIQMLSSGIQMSSSWTMRRTTRKTL
jgi:hypothetical protein